MERTLHAIFLDHLALNVLLDGLHEHVGLLLEILRGALDGIVVAPFHLLLELLVLLAELLDLRLQLQGIARRALCSQSADDKLPVLTLPVCGTKHPSVQVITCKWSPPWPR